MVEAPTSFVRIFSSCFITPWGQTGPGTRQSEPQHVLQRPGTCLFWCETWLNWGSKGNNSWGWGGGQWREKKKHSSDGHIPEGKQADCPCPDIYGYKATLGWWVLEMPKLFDLKLAIIWCLCLTGAFDMGFMTKTSSATELTRQRSPLSR